MPNWFDIEKQLSKILKADYYRRKYGIPPESADEYAHTYAHKYVEEARGKDPALATYTGEITVLELKHPARSDSPTRFVRAFDTSLGNSNRGWWIDYALFDRFRRASSMMSLAERDQAIKEFMRARSAVPHDFNKMTGLVELNLPVGERTPALTGKAHHQRIIANPKSEEYKQYYVPNVFFIGGDLQYYICIRDPGWIRPATPEAA
jgi:hypothetical protein